MMVLLISCLLTMLWIASIVYRLMFLGPITWMGLILYALASYLVLCGIEMLLFTIYYIVTVRKKEK